MKSSWLKIRIPKRLVVVFTFAFLVPIILLAWIVSYVNAANSSLAGVCWALPALQGLMTSMVQTDQAQTPAFRIRITEGGDEVQAGAVAMSFRRFPLPWRISVSQTAGKTLEASARRENIFYRVVFSLMIAVMLGGAFLVARDLAREAEANALKNEFVHNVSHELKTPHTSIRDPPLDLRNRKSLFLLLTSHRCAACEAEAAANDRLGGFEPPYNCIDTYLEPE